MRQPNYILEHYPDFRLTQYEQLLNSDRFTEQDKLSAAFEILNIDEIKFNHIPFITDKQSLLDYKYNLTHFELCTAKFEQHQWIVLDRLKELAKQAAQIIMHQPVMTKHQDRYSKFAQGLSSLNQRTGHFATAINESIDMTASIIHVGAKTGGVEPGFMAAHHQDIVTWLVKHFEYDEKSLIEFINVNKGDIGQVFELIKDNLPEYLYKLDYKTVDRKLPSTSGATQVFLTAEDVQRTSKIKKSYQYGGNLIGNIVTGVYVIAKQSTALEVNKEAVLETLSNDFASFFMQVQQQKLFITTHTNDALKLMPQAAWVVGSDQFGSDKNPLIGADDDTHNYRGKKLVMPREGITSLTDKSIMHASRLLLPLLFTGDYDKIGSLGQNLLILKASQNEITGQNRCNLVGIDFGHTLRENNPLLHDKHILADGRFIQPTHLFNHPFKNFSALSDGSVSDKMQGALILARLRGIKIDDTVIASYGHEFSDFYYNIPPGEANTLCDNYKHAFKEMQEDDYNNWEEYHQYIDAVEQFKERMNNDMDQILSIFKGYLHHSSHAVDLADNLNKRCAAALGKTSLRSRNGHHGLEHIVIHQDYPKTFNIALNDDNHYIFSCSFNKQELNIIEQALGKKNSPNMAIENENGELKIRFHKIHLNEVAELFNETELKIEYHQHDYEAIKAGCDEIRLQDFIKAPWFIKNNIEMDLSLNPGDKNQYRITLYAAEGKFIPEPLADIITNQLQKSLSTNSLILDFDSFQLSEVIHNLEMIQNMYEAHLEREDQKKNSTLITQSDTTSVVLQEVEVQSSTRLGIDVPLTFFHHPSSDINFAQDRNEKDEDEGCALTEKTSKDLFNETSFVFISRDDQASISAPDNFKKILKQLIAGYESLAYVESTVTNSPSTKVYGMFYSLGKNIINTVWPIAGTSTALIPVLKKYIENEHDEKTEDIIFQLKNRRNHVNLYLLDTMPEKYSIEMALLDAALFIGSELINNQKEHTTTRGLII